MSKEQEIMSTNFVDRKNDEEIIDLINSILSNGKMQVETINEAVLVKLMEIRNTPIKYDKSYRDIDKDFERWQNEQTKTKKMSKNVVAHIKGKQIIVGSVNEKNEFRYDIDFDMSLLSREARKYLEETYNIKYRWKDRDESMKKKGWHYLSDY